MLGEDAHLESAYEERHEIDLSYTEAQDFAAEADDEDEIEDGECEECELLASECECTDEPGHGYWEAGDYP